jgi:hypothetical protein
MHNYCCSARGTCSIELQLTRVHYLCFFTANQSLNFFIYAHIALSIQLQLIPSVQGHIDAARQFLEARDFHSAIEHLGEAIEVCLLSSNHVLYQLNVHAFSQVYPAPCRCLVYCKLFRVLIANCWLGADEVGRIYSRAQIFKSVNIAALLAWIITRVSITCIYFWPQVKILLYLIAIEYKSADSVKFGPIIIVCMGVLIAFQPPLDLENPIPADIPGMWGASELCCIWISINDSV